MADAREADERGWIPWGPGERESFFDAIERHRRASWRMTAVCAFAIGVLALVLAILLAPLLICLIGLAVDVVNLVLPMPDVLGGFGSWIDPLFDEDTFRLDLLGKAMAVAAVPGLVVMGIAVLALARALKRSPLFDGADTHGRAPDRSVLAEQRLANVVEEMAIAAGIPVPHVRIVAGGINAAVFGRDESRTTILAGEGLVASLDRAQMQGAVAHLIGSIAGGDMPIGLRTALTFALFGLMARLKDCFGARDELHHVVRLLRTLVWPTRAGTERLIAEVADPFAPRETLPGHATPAAAEAAGPVKKKSDLTWREWALMPLVGPLVMSGFVSGIVSSWLLRPLVSFAWRRRKYMADAAAVKLTRDPDALAATLHAILSGGGTGLQSWAKHLAIAQDGAGGGAGLLDDNLVSIFPSVERRYRALGRLGASLRPTARQAAAMPLAGGLLAGVLGAIVGGLMAVVVVLMIWLSIALSGLFTVLPATLLHALLRAIGR
jgi:Zn-dependent protease with chaperone function